MRTYTKADWDDAQVQWQGFSSEWREVRHQAAMRGILFPPEGTAHDSWADEHPSQRAQLIKAIRETPALLREAIAHASSWYGVIDFINRRRVEWREHAEEEELDERRDKERNAPEHREAVMVLGAVLQRLDDSRTGERGEVT